MSLNININEINYECTPIVNEGFNGKKENIAWMCNEKKKVETFINATFTCPDAYGVKAIISGSNYSTICNWNSLTYEQCRTIDGIMNSSVCQKTANMSCPKGDYIDCKN
jgi:hypothetical protein